MTSLGAPSIWLRPERGSRGPTPRLTRPGVAAAAIELADADGLAAVTMRSVASVLGKAPASLYRVIESRDELLELMTDTVIGEFTYSTKLSGSGPEGLLSLARQARSLYGDIPGCSTCQPQVRCSATTPSNTSSTRSRRYATSPSAASRS